MNTPTNEMIDGTLKNGRNAILRYGMLLSLIVAMLCNPSLHADSSIIPFLEGFESGSLSNLSDAWSFETTGAGRIALEQNTSAPGGSNILVMNQGVDCCDGYGSESAVLTLNLAGKTNVTLDFNARQAGLYNILGGATVSISQDGNRWVPVSYLDWSAFSLTWRHVTIHLDPLVEAQGLAFDADFHIRFSFEPGYYGRSCVWLWDQIRVNTDSDVSGPSIIELLPATPQSAPLTSCRVTFGEPVSLASMDPSTVRILDPAGNPVLLDPGLPVAMSEDQLTFTLRFAAPQALPGIYRVELDQRIADLQGNWLDQNRDGISDGYAASFAILSSVARFPAYENFPGGSLTRISGAWSFATTGAGLVSLVPEGPPTNGPFHLRFDQGGYGSESAILSVNLEGRTHVQLDFDAQEAALYNMIGAASVSISQDRSNWVSLASLNWQDFYTIWRHVSLNLDPVVAAAGLHYGADFQIRFSFEAGRYGRRSAWIWREILVSSLTDAERTLAIRQNAAGIELGFRRNPDFDYTVQFRNRLNQNEAWQALPDAPHNSGSIAESSSRAASRFYRLSMSPR